MSLFNLILHSLSIIAVFKSVVFLRSAILLIILSFFLKDLGIFVIFSQICLVFFNLIIYAVSLRESERDFMNSQDNKKNSILI